MKLASIPVTQADAPQPSQDPAIVAKRNAVGLREMYAIAASWQLGTEDLAKLLGTSLRSLQRWRKLAEDSGALELASDTVERMSYLLGIQKALRILLPTPENQLRWLRNANSEPVFAGQAPLARMLQGRVADLYVVRHYLDGMRG